MAIVRRSLVVALALVTAGLEATDAQEGLEGRRLGPAPRLRPRPRPRPAPRPAPRPRGGDGPLFPEDIIWDIDGGENGKDLGLAAAEPTTKETEEPGRKEKDLSRAAPAPRPAPRPCTTTKPVLKPNPYEEASEPGDTIAARPQDPDEEKASKKRPGEPDIDIVIDSDGS